VVIGSCATIIFHTPGIVRDTARRPRAPRDLERKTFRWTGRRRTGRIDASGRAMLNCYPIELAEVKRLEHVVES